MYVPRAAKVLVPMTRQLVQSLSCIDNLPTDLVAKLLRYRLAVAVCELTCWYYGTVPRMGLLGTCRCGRLNARLSDRLRAGFASLWREEYWMMINIQ